jgi:hypothetical protein
MVLGLVPGPGDFVEVGAECLFEDDGVGGEELEEGAADGWTGGRAVGQSVLLEGPFRLSVCPPVRLSIRLVSDRLRIDGQHRYLAQLLKRALRSQIESPQR